MTDHPTTRRLAAVLIADVAEYTRLIERDAAGTIAEWQADRDDIVKPTVSAYEGRIVKFTGDGFLVEFPTVQNAVQCAIDLQEALAASSLGFRMGLNLGDIMDDGQDVYGEGINVAARLEGLATPGGICVSGMVYDLVRNSIDAEFADLGMKEVKHVSVPVRVYALNMSGAAAGQPEEAAPVDRSSIAVLPFENMSGDLEQDYFSDGITEDLITTLSQIAQLSVVPRNSAFTYKNRTVSAEEVGKALNCAYVVTGSLRKSGGRVRITVQLSDTQIGTNLWVERYDREIDDIFAVQDEITLTIATALQVNLTEGEQARLRYTTTNNVEAWTHFVHGLSHFRTVSADTYREARRCFEQALEHDPDSAQIYAMLAFVHAIEGRFYWTKDRDESLRMAKVNADRALELDPDNADALGALGYWHMSHRRLDEAVDAYSRAVELAPRHADLHALFALALTFAEHPIEAVQQAQMAIDLNPLDPGWYSGILGHALRYAGRHEEAIETLYDYHRRSAGYGLVDIVLTCADMNRLNEAKENAHALLAARPDFTVEQWALTQNCADLTRLENDRQSLYAAGLP